MLTIWLKHTGYIGRQSKFQFVFGLQSYTEKCVASLLSTGEALMWDGGRGHGQLRLKFLPAEICRGLGIILPSHSRLCSPSEGIQPAPFTVSAPGRRHDGGAGKVAGQIYGSSAFLLGYLAEVQ